MRSYTPIDQVIIQFADCLNTFFAQPYHATARPNPSNTVPMSCLTPQEAQSAIRMMRVNHAGEVCAQALYQGQSLVARKPALRAHLQHAAQEEADHLRWCADRIATLGGKTSQLNPLWYLGSVLIGMIAGLCGDKVSLGFLAETEAQVSEHLDTHLRDLPAADRNSRAIVAQMQIDEQSHADAALAQGGIPLPLGVSCLMRLSAKIMTTLAAYL